MQIFKKASISLCVLSMGIVTQSAQASLVAAVCEVNGRNACGTERLLNSSDSIITIRGYAYNPINKERPVSGQFIRIRHEDSGVVYRIPIQKIESRPDVISNLSKDKNFSLTNFNESAIGFTARAFMLSLVPGRYSVIEARVQMSAGSTLFLTAEGRGTFVVPYRESDQMFINAPDGRRIPLTLTQNLRGDIVVSNYPPLRDGNYRLEAQLSSLKGLSTTSELNFIYRRPIVTYEFNIPLVKDFPGISQKISLRNPLTENYISDEEIKLISENNLSDDNLLEVDNVRMITGSEVALKKGGDGGRRALASEYTAKIQDDHDSAGSYETKFFVELPDAPSIVFRVNRWSPDTQMHVEQSKPASVVKLEPIYTASYLTKRNLCVGLTTVSEFTPIVQSDYSGVGNCAIRWKKIPFGITPNRRASGVLQGPVPFLGENSFVYESGIIYKNPESLSQMFYPSKSGEKILVIMGLEPPPVSMNFKPHKNMLFYYNLLKESHPGTYFIQTNESAPIVAGIMETRSSFPKLVSRVTYHNGTVQEFSGNRNFLNFDLAFNANMAWNSYPIKVESWHADASDFKSVLDLSLLSVPAPPTITANIPGAHDQSDVVVTGAIGLKAGSGSQIFFDKDLLGEWKAQVLLQTSNGMEVFGEPVTIADDGAYAINLGILPEGRRRIVVEAIALDKNESGVKETNLKISTRRQNLNTVFGGDIPGVISTRYVYGVVPFNYQLEFVARDRSRRRDLGEVRWEVQNESGGWDRILNDAIGLTGSQEEYVGNIYNGTLNQATSKTIRAISFNKNSGISFATDPLTVQAYDMPSFSISAPRVVAVQKPVTANLVSADIDDLDYEWSVSARRGSLFDYEIVSNSNNPSFTFVPKSSKEYYISLRVKNKNSPDIESAYKTLTSTITAVNPLANRAQIQGPNLVEAGKIYRFSAIMNNAASNFSDEEKSYTVKGYWSLPDGSRVDSLDLDYMPKMGDSGLAFFTYIDGFPEETSVAFHDFDVWEYKWPDVWAIDLEPIYIDVPALIDYSVVAPGFDFAATRNEPIRFELLLPQNVSIDKVNESGSKGRLSVNAAGEHQLQVRISDSRGNVSTVTSNIFNVMPTLRVQSDGKFTSVDPMNMYAPGNYYFKFTYLDIPRKDSVLKHTLFVNDMRITEFSRIGVHVPIESPGEHEVKIRTETLGGNWGELIKNVVAIDPPKPVCEITRQQYDRSIVFERTCTLEAGSLNALFWTYVIDGIARDTTAKRLTFDRAVMADGRVSSVRLTARTNLGAEAIVTVPAIELTTTHVD